MKMRYDDEKEIILLYLWLCAEMTGIQDDGYMLLDEKKRKRIKRGKEN